MASKLNPYTGKLQLLNESSGEQSYPLSLQQDFLAGRSLNVSGQTPNSFITFPISILGEVTIQGLTIELTTVGTGNALVGIYDTDSNGDAGSLLDVVTSEYDLTITGQQTINFATPLKLSVGTYNVAFTRDGSGGLFRVSNIVDFSYGVNGTTIYQRSSVARTYDGTLPTTAPTPNYLAGGAPRVTFNLI